MMRTRPNRLAWLACLLGLAPCSLPADIYKQVLPDGTVSYSSEPQPNAEKITPPPPQVIPAARPASTPAPERPSQPPAPAYARLSITEPADDQVVWSNERNVGVALVLDPPLRVEAGHRLVLLVDGTPVPSAADALSLTLNNVDRGTHTLTAEVHDAAGRTLIQSTPVTFHLKQHSVLLPRRPTAP